VACIDLTASTNPIMSRIASVITQVSFLIPILTTLVLDYYHYRDLPPNIF